MGANESTTKELQFEYQATEENGHKEIEKNYVVISKDNNLSKSLYVQYGHDNNDDKDKVDDIKQYVNIDNDDNKATSTPRILMYYSPTENNQADPITISQIASNINSSTNKPYVTHIEICTLHLSKFNNNDYIHINDESPTNTDFTEIKNQISTAQSAGIKVLFMLGGAEGKAGTAPTSESSWVNLFNDWNTFYPSLINLFKEWNVDGIDLDCENANEWQHGTSNYNNICKLISSIHNDMGNEFKIVLAPVAKAIYDNTANGSLSGFNYKKLMTSSYGQYINWLNLQFYNGWGTLNSPNDYEKCVNVQKYNSAQLVAGMIDCSSTTSKLINDTITSLSNKYGNDFGGVFVWKGNTKDVIKWSETMQKDINA